MALLILIHSIWYFVHCFFTFGNQYYSFMFLYLWIHLYFDHFAISFHSTSMKWIRLTQHTVCEPIRNNNKKTQMSRVSLFFILSFVRWFNVGHENFIHLLYECMSLVILKSPITIYEIKKNELKRGARTFSMEVIQLKNNNYTFSINWKKNCAIFDHKILIMRAVTICFDLISSFTLHTQKHDQWLYFDQPIPILE